MAYNLPMQVSLQVDPGSIAAVRRQIESSFAGIQVQGLDTKSFAKANAAIENTRKNLDKGTGAAKTFWDALEGKARGIVAYTVASTALLKLTSIVSNATREAIKYETELLKISQTTGDTVKETNQYSRALVDISKKYNVTLSKVALLTRTLAQTGLSFREAAKGAEVLARTSLLASFDSIQSTTEGLIATMQTFSFSVSRAGKVLESINAVSKAFAVESGDIVEAIKRTGGAFSTAGGQIEELIALFTSVRSTTRESAETIATGFRTIFGRLQRPKTIEYFKQLGIQLETAEDQFIGPYQAILRISEGLDRLGISVGDIKFAEVVEQIGGIRQISRVIPLLTQAAKTQKALDVANNASTESVEDLEKAQQGLGFQLGVLQKEFGALISDVVNSSSFKFLADVFINVSKAVIRLTSSLKPLLPFLSFIATWKIGSGLGQLLGGKFNFKGIKDSLGFARGGMVPGSGNGDTVPAMLTPGEFVIRKSAVKAFGADRLAKINKYASGGYVSAAANDYNIIGASYIPERQAYTFDKKSSEKFEKDKKFNAKDKIQYNLKENPVDVKRLYSANTTDPLYNKYIKETNASKRGLAFEKIVRAQYSGSFTKSDRGSSYLDGVFNNQPAEIKSNETVSELKLGRKFLASAIAGNRKSKETSDKLSGNRLQSLALTNKPETVDLGELILINDVTTGITTEDKSKAASQGATKTVDLGRIQKTKKYQGGLIQKFAEGGIVEDLKRALSTYVDDSSQINTSLSVGTAFGSVENTIKSLDQLFKYDPPAKLYSGFGKNRTFILTGGIDPSIPEFLDLIIGETRTFPGYLSASENQDVAGNFRTKNGVLATIKPKAPTIDVRSAIKDLDLSLPRSRLKEEEFILPKGSRFMVDNFEYRGDSYKNTAELTQLNQGGLIQKFAKGGSVGTDTVPALLTPGEFVINKQSAQSFGYNNLKKINRYADGGIVQNFQNGGTAKPIGSTDLFPGFDKKPFNLLQTAAIKLANSFRSTESLINDAGAIIDSMSWESTVGMSWDNLGIALNSYATALNESGTVTPSQINLMVKGYDKAIADLEKSGKTAAELREAENEMVKALKDATARLEGFIPPVAESQASSVALDEAAKSASANVNNASRPPISRTDKADRTLSARERKERAERYKAEQAVIAASTFGGDATPVTRQERAEKSGKAGSSQIIANAKKLYQEEQKRLQAYYQEKLDNAAKEGESTDAILSEYKDVLGDFRKQVQSASRLNLKDLFQQLIDNAKKEGEDTEQLQSDMWRADFSVGEAVDFGDDALKVPVEELKEQVEEAAVAAKTFGQKVAEGASNAVKALGEINFAEAALKVQAFASALQNFGGFDINQEALTQAQVKGGQFATAGELVGKAADPQVVKQFGSTLNQVGKSLPKSIGGPVRQLGGTLLKNADSIAKSAGMAAKALNVLSIVELGGGLIDSLFSVDYSSQRDNLIQLGDAAGAAQAAASAYAQEQLRAIPIIGGFLAAFAPVGNISEESLDANGRLVVANARLEASLNGVDDQVKKAKAAFSEASALGDQKGQQDAINAQLDAAQTLKTNAEEVAIRQEAAGGPSGFSVIGGAAGGALAGAAIGSVIPVIGTLFGGLIGAVAGGAAAWYMSSSASEEQIIKGYELSSEAIKKGAEIQISLIEGIGAQLENEAVKMVRSGGTFEDAIKKVTEQVGEANMRRILDGRQLSGDPEVDIKTLSAESQTLDTRITELKIKQSQEEDDVKKQAMQTQIDSMQADKDKIDSLKGVLVQTQAAIIREKQLEERRQLQAKAMEYQIKLMKEMETAFDGFNASLREANNIAEEAANIGTGRLTTRQAAQMSGVGDSRLYEMDSSEIVRNRDVATQMATRVGMGTMRGQEIMRGQERVSTIDRIQGEVVNTGALSDILKDIKPGETADAKQIQDEIYKKLGLTPGADPVLDESIRQYSEKIAKDGLSAAGQAAQEAKEEATKQSKEIIENQQRVDKQLIEQQKKLRNDQIDNVNKVAELAQQAYDVEKDYFEKRSNLANKIQDFLNPIQEGPMQAAGIRQRGIERTGRQRSALQQRRGAQFQKIDDVFINVSKLGGQNLGQAVNTVVAGMRQLAGVVGDAGTAEEELIKQKEVLINTIQDEIDIEQQYLDVLMESAKAQQEYTQALNDAQGQLVRDLVTGTEEEQADLLNNLNFAAMAAQQGSFAGIPEEMKKGVFSVFDQFANVVIPGLGVTGRDAQRQITQNELMRNFGVDQRTASQLASKAVEDRVPIDQKIAEQIKMQGELIEFLFKEELKLKEAQLERDAENTKKFGEHVKAFGQKVENMKQQAGTTPDEMPQQENLLRERDQLRAERDVKIAENKKKEEDIRLKKEESDKTASERKETMTKAGTELDNYADRIEELRRQEKKLELEITKWGRVSSREQLKAVQESKKAAEESYNLAVEKFKREEFAYRLAVDTSEIFAKRLEKIKQDAQGIVEEYKQKENELMQNRLDQRDALPSVVSADPMFATALADAALDPRGEAEKAAQQAALRSKGGIIYASNGKLIDFEPKGTDTVPAMLTPGEFVINRKATQNNLPLLEAINSGKYSRGGIVYAQKGGEIGENINQLMMSNSSDADTIFGNILYTLRQTLNTSAKEATIVKGNKLQNSILDLNKSMKLQNEKMIKTQLASFIISSKFEKTLDEVKSTISKTLDMAKSNIVNPLNEYYTTGYNSGGIVYASKGQHINFQPKGTDTVPAMLTPGEFVINRDATRKNLPLLQAINNGNMKESEYFQNGGVAGPGADEAARLHDLGRGRLHQMKPEEQIKWLLKELGLEMKEPSEYGFGNNLGVNLTPDERLMYMAQLDNQFGHKSSRFRNKEWRNRYLSLTADPFSALFGWWTEDKYNARANARDQFIKQLWKQSGLPMPWMSTMGPMGQMNMPRLGGWFPLMGNAFPLGIPSQLLGPLAQHHNSGFVPSMIPMRSMYGRGMGGMGGMGGIKKYAKGGKVKPNYLAGGGRSGNDGTFVPEQSMDYRAELEQKIKNLQEEKDSYTSGLGVFGGAFDFLRKTFTGDGGRVSDAISRSQIAAYKVALNSGNEEEIKRLATGVAYGGPSQPSLAAHQDELLNQQNKLTKELYMTVPKALAGTVVGTAASSYSAISGAGLSGSQAIGMNLAIGTNAALPVALMNQSPNEGKFDKKAIGREVLAEVLLGPALDLVPGSSIISNSASMTAGALRSTRDVGATLLGEGIDITGRAAQSVVTSKIKEKGSNYFANGGAVGSQPYNGKLPSGVGTVDVTDSSSRKKALGSMYNDLLPFTTGEQGQRKLAMGFERLKGVKNRIDPRRLKRRGFTAEFITPELGGDPGYIFYPKNIVSTELFRHEFAHALIAATAPNQFMQDITGIPAVANFIRKLDEENIALKVKSHTKQSYSGQTGVSAGLQMDDAIKQTSVYSTSALLQNPQEVFATIVQLLKTRWFDMADGRPALKAAMQNYGFQHGGLVYASKGQLINFQPKGTDTVPAMLTPGEFVVNRSATQRNLPLLQSINNGAKGYNVGGIVNNSNPLKYLQNGGPVNPGCPGCGSRPCSCQHENNRVKPPETNMARANNSVQNQPLEVNTQGQQDITIRLPDIQALINQSISSTIYETISQEFAKVADQVRSANNFEDVSNAMSNGITSNQTRNIGR